MGFDNNGNGITLQDYYDKKHHKRVRQLLRWAKVVIADESKQLIRDELSKFRDHLRLLTEAFYILSNDSFKVEYADKLLGIYRDYLAVQEYLNTDNVIMPSFGNKKNSNLPNVDIL